MRALRDFLLAPPAGGTASLEAPSAVAVTRRADRAAASVPETVAVLCSADDARAFGVACASVLARRARAACGLACVWTAPDPARRVETRAPASRGARRLASALAARGLAADACGRAAVVALEADDAVAVAAARRATAAAGDAPAVLVLGGPRPAGFDGLLAEQDRLLVLTGPGADGALGALAVAGLPDCGASAVLRSVSLSPAARALVAAGLAVPAPLRRALDAVVRAAP